RRRSGRRLGRYREVALRLVLRKSLAQSRPALAVAPAGGGAGGRSLLLSTASGHSGTLRTEEVDQQPVHSLGCVGLYPVAGLGDGRKAQLRNPLPRRLGDLAHQVPILLAPDDLHRKELESALREALPVLATAFDGRGKA